MIFLSYLILTLCTLTIVATMQRRRFLDSIILTAFFLRSGRILYRGEIYRLIEFPGGFIESLCFVVTVCCCSMLS